MILCVKHLLSWPWIHKVVSESCYFIQVKSFLIKFFLSMNLKNAVNEGKAVILNSGGHGD